MEKCIQQGCPGAAFAIGIIRQVACAQHRHDAEQMTRKLFQRCGLEARFVLAVFGAVETHHDTVCAGRREAVDGHHDLMVEIFPGQGGIKLGDAVTDQRIEQLRFGLVPFQRSDLRTLGHDEADARPFFLDDRVCPLRRGVTDVIRRKQQFDNLFLTVNHLRRLFQPFEETLREIVWRGDGLGVYDLGPIDHTDVSQRATVVDVDQFSHGVLPLSAWLSPALATHFCTGRATAVAPGKASRYLIYITLFASLPVNKAGKHPLTRGKTVSGGGDGGVVTAWSRNCRLFWGGVPHSVAAAQCLVKLHCRRQRLGSHLHGLLLRGKRFALGVE